MSGRAFETSSLDLVAYLYLNGREAADVRHAANGKVKHFRFRRDEELETLVRAFLSGRAMVPAKQFCEERVRVKALALGHYRHAPEVQRRLFDEAAVNIQEG